MSANEEVDALKTHLRTQQMEKLPILEARAKFMLVGGVYYATVITCENPDDTVDLFKQAVKYYAELTTGKDVEVFINGEKLLEALDDAIRPDARVSFECAYKRVDEELPSTMLIRIEPIDLWGEAV